MFKQWAINLLLKIARKGTAMDSQAIKELMYGGISELINNPAYYRKSPINWEYCKFTDKGAAALLQYMNMMAVNIMIAQTVEDDRRAKEMVLETLTKSDIK